MSLARARRRGTCAHVVPDDTTGDERVVTTCGLMIDPVVVRGVRLDDLCPNCARVRRAEAARNG